MGSETEKYFRRRNQAERIGGFLLLGLLLLLGYCAFLLATGESPDTPEDVSFSIIDEYEDTSGIKRQLEVRLNEKITVQKLREIFLLEIPRIQKLQTNLHKLLPPGNE